jgi:tetratricopeptide (TPR) repeat protein
MDTLDDFSRLTEAALHREVALELSLQNRESDAVAEYNKAIELDPESAEAYYRRGMSYDSLGEFECAVEDYTEAIRLDPDYPEAYSFRATAHYMLMQEDISLTKEVAQRTINRAIARGDDTAPFRGYLNDQLGYLYRLDIGAIKKEREQYVTAAESIFYDCLGRAFFIEY